VANFEDLVERERMRQDDKWGIQNHMPYVWLAILGEEYGELQQAILERSFGDKEWADIEKEIIQCAAVLKAMWECAQRNPEWTSSFESIIYRPFETNKELPLRK